LLLSFNAASDAPLPRPSTLPIHMADAEVNALFASCLPALRKATKRMMHNVQDSEDVLQDGLLLAFKKLHQFEGRASFSTWLHSIVRNCSLMYFRKESAQRGAIVDLPPETKELLLEQACVDACPSPEEQCIQQERSAILRKATRELPPQYHDAIKCFHLEGLGEEETARRLHMTPSALKAQLHCSRRILTRTIRSSYLPEHPEPAATIRETAPRRSAARMHKYRRGEELTCRRAKNTML
jgi:RNA polymerase sigma factor (sigma-70 family)